MLPHSREVDVGKPGDDRGALRARSNALPAIYLGGLLVGAGFAVFALMQLRSTTRSLGNVISEHTDNALEVQHLTTLSERLGRLSRSYLLTATVRRIVEGYGEGTRFSIRVPLAARENPILVRASPATAPVGASSSLAATGISRAG
jgi:hypothetical protein